LGYRGVAKRLPSTQPAGSTHPPKDTAIALPDGLRQFIHELRTPLNAVRGFAELIASQIFGPVSQIYQRLAGQIIEDAEAIVDLLDDLPFFQPSQRKIAYGSGYQPIDPSGIIRQVFEKAQVAAMKRQALLVFQVDPDLPRLRLDGSLFRRLIERFIALVVALSGPHDQVHAQSSQRGQGLLLSVRRPHALRDVADAGLFDPNREPDYDHNVAPFGIGYGFRLVWALARALGGQLETSHSRLSLYVSG
jgi:K+-sensing histidine kinase KdpD